MGQLSYTDLELNWDKAWSEPEDNADMAWPGDGVTGTKPGDGETGTNTKEGMGHSAADALVLSLVNKGKVDMAYMAKLTKKDPIDVVRELGDAIYRNPEGFAGAFSKGWETREQYLSGNLMNKLKAAEAANQKFPELFDRNIKALKEVLPKGVGASQIYITLGSPWVPVEIIDDFICHILGQKKVWSRTSHDELTGSWEISDKGYYSYTAVGCIVYGTQRISALHILEKTLNMKPVVVYDEESCTTNKSGVKRVINKAETVAAGEKQAKLVAEFKQWVWKDRDRKRLLEGIYAQKYGHIKQRAFDGSFLTFPGMNPDISLYPYQKNAVARILFSSNTLLAHDVGAGKTYIMIAAAMELRRMKLSAKNLFVVPNNIVGQWESIFKGMYPEAKILTVDPNAFAPDKRKEVLGKIRDGEYDGIIMAYSCFDMIPISKDYHMEQLKAELAEATKQAAKAKKSTAALRKKVKTLEKKLGDLAATGPDGEGVYFDQLGVSRLFVDEAHNYKNVAIETKAGNVLGVSRNGSEKCRQLLETKQRFIADLLAGSLNERSGSDIDDTVLNYAEVKALAVGNPLIKERVETANELTRLITLRRKCLETRENMARELEELPEKIHRQEERVKLGEADCLYLAELERGVKPAVTKEEKAKQAEIRKGYREKLDRALREKSEPREMTAGAAATAPGKMTAGAKAETGNAAAMTYRGFDILIPEHMPAKKPFVWIRHFGKYPVEIGDAQKGNLVRIDNALDKLRERIDEYKKNLELMKERQADIRQALGRKESYDEAIVRVQGKLTEIDEKIGVNKTA